MKIFIVPFIFLLISSTAAQENATWQGTLEGSPFHVTVVARGHAISEEVRRTQPWWQWGNTSTDAYIFSFGEDRGVDLVLDFGPLTGQEGIIQATLFHLSDESRFGVVVSSDAPEGYSLPADVDPALTVQPLYGGWVVDGKANFNLIKRNFVRYNGDLQEFYGEVRAARPGVPLWATNRLMNDRNPHLGYPRFGASVRADPTVPYELATPLMPTWPYLSVTSSAPHWGANRPIVFETSKGRLSQFWASFHTAGSYQFNSISLPPHTDFEAPFAFYRFDSSAGQYANLALRSVVWPASSPFGPPIWGVPRTSIRMSWTAENPTLWRYSLTVLGNHVMTDQVSIGRTRVRAVPYKKFPRWVTEKPWKVVTFVEATEGEEGSEGIYDYAVVDNYQTDFWAAGLRETVPGTFHSPFVALSEIDPRRLSEGFRGEYSAVYNRAPQLYISPVDNRVHLLHATEGLWNLGAERILRVANLDNDPHLDAWWREKIEVNSRRARAQDGEREEALYSVDDFFVHVASSTVTLKKSVHPASLGTPPVPTDRTAWGSFLGATSSLEPRDPWDLRPWLEAFPGETLELHGATLSNVESSEREFRFVLELPEEVRLSGTLAIPLFGSLTPGRYLIRYDRRTKTWGGEAASPPKLAPFIRTSALTTFTPGSLELHLRNRGNLSLTADATLRVGPTVMKRWEALYIEGRSTLHEVIPWVPNEPGTWPVTLRVGAERFPLGTVEVKRTPRVAELNAFLLPIEDRLISLGLLGAAVLLCVGTLWTTWRTS